MLIVNDVTVCTLNWSDRRTHFQRQRLAQTTSPIGNTWSSAFCGTLCRQLPLLSPSLRVYYGGDLVAHTNKPTSCWCGQYYHTNTSRTWFSCCAASTHMFKIHEASGNPNWPTTGAFLDACRQPWFKAYTEVYQHLIMTICATSRTPNRQRVPRYSNCLVWPCMVYRYPCSICFISSWSVGLSCIHFICTNIVRD